MGRVGLTKAQLERGYRLVELLKQPLNSPMAVEDQVVSIYAGTNGYLDDLPVEDVGRFEAELLEHVRSSHASLLDELRSGGVPDALGEIIESFKGNFKVTAASDAPADATATDADELGDAESAKTLATE